MIKEGTIVKAIAGFFYVASSGEVYECRAKGRFRKDELTPIAGDRVKFELDGEKGFILEVRERKNELLRPPLANIDCMLIVLSVSDPAPDLFLIDKLTVISELYGIKAVILLNKNDLSDTSGYEEIYRSAGYDVLSLCAIKDEGLLNLKNVLPEGFLALCGSSGVGKSTILNMLIGKGKSEVGEISERTSRGKHTTRHSEIFTVDERRFIADTPGFSSLDISRIEGLNKDNLQELYPEFSEFIGGCKFKDCSHYKEIECEVLKAFGEGKILPSRMASYHMFYEALKDIKKWENKK